MHVTPAPAYCYQCGQPFPWTAETIQAAKDLADDLDELSAEDRVKLKAAIDQVSVEGPQSEVGAARIKKLISTGGSAAGKALWNMVTTVATEAAKKVLTGGL